MREKIIKAIKIVFGIFVIFLGVLLILGLIIKYNVSWKLTDVGEEISPDGRYRLLFQAIGEADFPFGSSHARVTLYDDDRKITSFDEDIADDGGQFRPENYSVIWMPYGAVITFTGSEQADHEEEVFYDGRESFEGYTDEEIKSILKSRYNISDVERITKVGGGYRIKADGINFFADDKMSFHNSYQQELVKAITEEVFPKVVQRSLEWDIQEGETPADIIYTPVISMNGPGKQDIDAFCSDICRWLEYCFERLPYEEGKDAYTGFIPSIPGYQNVKYYYNDTNIDKLMEDNADFYNSLYIFLNRYMDHEFDDLYQISDESNTTDEITEEADEESSELERTEENIKQWASYEPEIIYDFPDGNEYALVAVDRALGSSFYVLLSYAERGNADSASLINQDPYNGQCGTASFMTFLDDNRTGFIGLTFNGGSEGLLYMTTDAGKSFREVILPSPNIELPDGKLYNPFVVIEDAWEESGKIYLKVGQGSEGDYYNDELDGHPYGIYVSEDNGESFSFLKETVEKGR